MQHLNIELL